MFIWQSVSCVSQPVILGPLGLLSKAALGLLRNLSIVMRPSMFLYMSAKEVRVNLTRIFKEVFEKVMKRCL